jgi:nitrate/nitrite-specific signal transduction histidine kinase
VPLTVKGDVLAVAWASTLRDYRRFSQEEVDLARVMGNELGLLIRDAQLYEQSKQLAVMEERGSLAREIHDGMAQTLGALRLKASQLEDAFDNQKIDESQGYLSELEEMISGAYRDLREAILGLRAAVDPGEGLVAALREYVTHYQAQHGLDVLLEARDDKVAALDGETQVQAMRVVQEALSNVRRHAGTDSATLQIIEDSGGLRICIKDEGRGFAPGLLGELHDGLHLGLRTMRERAESVGGTLTIQSSPGQGTRVVLQLPTNTHGGSA